VIVTTLPRAVNLQEEFLTTYLRDAAFMRRRLNQRIVQALGRCNRSAEDFGVYLLADRRFATHFGPESNKAGIPGNIIAELDMAQDAAEIEEGELVRQVEAFMRGEFDAFDRALAAYLAALPAAPTPRSAPTPDGKGEDDVKDKDDVAEMEALGWTALFESLYYEIAAHNFEACWEAAKKKNILEMGAFHGWTWAKALYLESLRGEPGAKGKALQVMEEAMKRGSRSPWFNRQRASIMRVRTAAAETSRWPQQDYAASLLQRFDELLEVLGARGNRFERWCTRLTEQLSSAQCHASCHEVQSRRQEKIEHDLTGNTCLSLTSLACFSSPLSVRFPEMGQFSWEKLVKSSTVLPVLSCPARISPYFALHDSLRDTGPIPMKRMREGEVCINSIVVLIILGETCPNFPKSLARLPTISWSANGRALISNVAISRTDWSDCFKFSITRLGVSLSICKCDYLMA